MEGKIRLSASKINTFLDCSARYKFSYIDRVPQAQHPATSMGTITHLILELLHNRPDYVKRIIKNGTIYCIPSLQRLVLKHCAKEKLRYDPAFHIDTLSSIDAFTLVGLKKDYNLKGYSLNEPEIHYELEGDNFKLMGFIDRSGVKPNKIKIRDFKTSKVKKSSSSLDFDIQALCYALGFSTLYPEIDEFEMEFVFLRFSKKPFASVTFNREQLDGFKSYLEYLAEQMSNFTTDNTYDNTPVGSYKAVYMCGKPPGSLKKDGTPAWTCPYYGPFDYWVALNDKGKIIKSALDKVDLIEYNKVEKRHHYGCAMHNF